MVQLINFSIEIGSTSKGNGFNFIGALISRTIKSVARLVNRI